MTAQEISKLNNWFERAGELFCRDINLDWRQRKLSPESDEILASLIAEFDTEKSNFPLVYTAFDGDHQELGALMRQTVLKHNKIPVNPDSVLGYKETLEARYNKSQVLRDDLAVLRGCKELWVFTDYTPSPEGISNLAEGILVEICFFLKRWPGRSIKFISLEDLIKGKEARPTDLKTSFKDFTHSLPPGCEELVALANGGVLADSKIPSLIYFIIDPLDYKYSRFVRQDGYINKNKKTAPLVPNLAVDITDSGTGASSIGRIVFCWMKLMELATECIMYPSMETRGHDSEIAHLLECAWHRGRNGAKFEYNKWDSHKIPKHQLNDSWPISSNEKRRLKR